MKSLVFYTVAVGLVFLSFAHGADNYENYFRWKVAEFILPPNVKLNSSEFIQNNTIIATPKIYKDWMFLTTPRYLRGVPVTLSVVLYNRIILPPFFGPILPTLPIAYGEESPKLKPFPSYEKNKLGDCSALQMVESMEVDQFGRLWVVDSGRSNILEEVLKQGPALNLCPAKLVVFDLEKGSDYNKNFTYTFPNETAPYDSTILKDTTVACTTREDCWVYISDIGLSRIVVYDHKNRTSWTAQHPSMFPNPSKVNFTINGQSVSAPFGVTGQGLGPRRSQYSYLIFSPLASTTLYKINTTILKNPGLKENGTLNDNDVVTFGEKPSESDGFAMTSKGRLYYGNLENSSVLSTETSPQLMQIKEQKQVAQSKIDFSWPDTFTFDGKGRLLLTTTKFQEFVAGKINTSDYNYRVVRLKTDTVYAYNSNK